MNRLPYQQYRDRCMRLARSRLEQALAAYRLQRKEEGENMTNDSLNIWDIHTHIIPEADDGSESINMTLSMVYTQKQQNVTGVIATPHSSAFLEDPEGVRRKYSKTAAILETFFPKMRFCLGCEIACTPRSMAAVLANLRSGKFPAMNNTAYVLTEFPITISPEDMLYCLRLLVYHGWYPIIAHVERCVNLIDRPELVNAMKDLGCLLQLNISSLEEFNDTTGSDWARKLIQLELIDFISSDTHKSYYRPPGFTQGLQYLQTVCTREYLERILFHNAEEKLWKNACAQNGQLSCTDTKNDV